MTAPTPNAELAYRVLDQIDAHPASWRQDTYWCGSGGCFAGWAVELSGAKLTMEGLDSQVVEGPADLIGLPADEAAYEVLGIDDQIAGWHNEDRVWLFHAGNTREDLGRLVAEIFGPRPGGAS